VRAAPAWLSVDVRGRWSTLHLTFALAKKLCNFAFMDTAAIISDAAIMGGTPCLAGTRVPFRTLLDYLEGGETIAEFLEDFPSVSKLLAVAALQEAGELALAKARAA
jgi:uncharacterized protein (DUF433 family)